MFWRGGRQSGNIEDRRGFGGKAVGAGGLLLGALVVYLMGGDPVAYINENSGARVERQTDAHTDEISVNSGSPRKDDGREFVAVVLGMTEDVWAKKFSEQSGQYRNPSLVLFRDRVDSACGMASSAVGPFYCPPDQKIYLDLGFFDDLSSRLGAEGDTAAAYVIAHEVGHHVQHLLGLEQKARAGMEADPERKNQISVSLELQADCFAGIWAHEIEKRKKVFEPGDIQEAMGAASAVGDDRLQQRSRGEVMPDSFTHGSSAQRTAAFRSGYENGSIDACNF